MTRKTDSSLPGDDQVCALAREALQSLPISWDGMVVGAELAAHNPDEFDYVLELFGAQEEGHLRRQQKRAERSEPWLLAPSCAPQATVLSGRAFARHYDRPTRRVMWVMAPLLNKAMTLGLVVVQIDEARSGSAIAIDHWVLMAKDEAGAWHRRPIPAALREPLYLDDTTGGPL